jgi:hypothetical protein
MPDEITNLAKSSAGINNGAMITFAQETGMYITDSGSMINHFVPSGTIESRYESRFDEYRFYSGDTSG